MLILPNAWDAAFTALSIAAVYATTDRLTRGFLADGDWRPQAAEAFDYGALNGLMKS